MQDALATATFVVAIGTVLLFAFGRRPLPFGWRIALFGAAPIAVMAGSPLEVTATFLAIGVLTIALPWHWYPVGAVLFAALSVAFGLYAVYLARSVVTFATDPVATVLGLALLVLELAAFALLLGSAFEMIDALCAPDIDPGQPADPERWPTVCLQVPTYNEPPDLVIETIRSLIALDYPALQIQIIDNNTTNEALWRPVEEECRRLDVDGHAIDFVHLPEWPGYKGGALNWGRVRLAPGVEVVGVVDADYVVDPDWLRVAIPQFGDASVAFVQTPQDYRSWEDSGFYRACYVGFAYFFKVGMVSRARRNAIIFAGTMGLIRRAVLDEVGGWDERIITEDAEISLRVLAKGYRSVYIPRPFGRGIMPLTYEGLRKQRFRWAFGGIQILRRHWRTLLGRRSGLSLAQRYDHVMGGLWWFNDALTLGFTIFVAAAGLGAVTGRPFIVQRLTGIGIVLPLIFIGLNLVRYLWGLGVTTGARPPLALAALRVNLSLSWVIALACGRALTQERGVFLRTPKFVGTPAIRELRLVWVEAAIALSVGVLLLAILVEVGLSVIGIVLALLLAWPLLIYGSAVSYAIGDPKRAPLGEGLREKALLEIAPRVGRVAGSRPARAGVLLVGLVGLLLAGALASESDRSAISDLPFPDLPTGPGLGTRTSPGPSVQSSVSSEPSATPEASGPGISRPSRPGLASAGPGAAPTPSATPQRTPRPLPTGGPTTPPTTPPGPTPTPAPTRTPRRTPPVPIPTPTSSSRPTSRASSIPTPPAHPSPPPH